ncbi:hypothetical protein EV368DRAFT_78722 [Lentinula lateritia]|nr:hypothetical protein EV368DRAFT_78722 [Lentinula lateritia]
MQTNSPENFHQMLRRSQRPERRLEVLSNADFMRGSSSSYSALRNMPATYGLEYHFNSDSNTGNRTTSPALFEDVTVFNFMSHPSTAPVPDLTGCVANFDEQGLWPLRNIDAVSAPMSPSGFIASQISRPSLMLEDAHRDYHSGVQINLSKMDCTDLMSLREPVVANASTNVSKRFKCCDCGKEYTAKHNLRSHINYKHLHHEKKIECEFCGRRFTESRAHIRHLKNRNACPNSPWPDANVVEAREICWFKSLVSFNFIPYIDYFKHSSLVHSMSTPGFLQLSSLHILLLCVLSSIVPIITAASHSSPEPAVVLDIELIRHPHVGPLPIAVQFDKNDKIIPPPAVDEHGKPVAHPIDRDDAVVAPPKADEDWDLCIGGYCLKLLFDVSPRHLKEVILTGWNDEWAQDYIDLGRVTFKNKEQMYSVIRWFKKEIGKEPQSNLLFLNAVIHWLRDDAKAKGIAVEIKMDVWEAYFNAMHSVGGVA